MAAAQPQFYTHQPPITASNTHPNARQTSISRIKPHFWKNAISVQTKTPSSSLPSDLQHYDQFVGRDLSNLQYSGRHANRFHLLVNSLQHDLKYYADLKNKRLMGQMLLQNRNRGLPPNTGWPENIWGDGYRGYGNGWSENNLKILYSQQRKRFSQIPEKFYRQTDLEKQGGLNENLVPVRLDFEYERDRIQLRDTFTWNLNEQLISVDDFVKCTMEDLKLDWRNNSIVSSVVNNIKEQLQDYQQHIYRPSEFNNNKFKKRKYQETLAVDDDVDYDMRILIRIDITSGPKTLTDQFEWDINDPENNPEEFALCLCDDLSLPGEFATAIAHSIREQCQIYTKCLHLTGYAFRGDPVEDEDVRGHIRAIINPDSVLRLKSSLNDYTPTVNEVTELDLSKLDRERERETRRKRRAVRIGRRGGPQLPDLTDMPKTFRTPVISSVLPGAITAQLEAGDLESDLGSESSENEIDTGGFTTGRDLVVIKKGFGRFLVTFHLSSNKLAKVVRG